MMCVLCLLCRMPLSSRSILTPPFPPLPSPPAPSLPSPSLPSLPSPSPPLPPHSSLPSLPSPPSLLPPLPCVVTSDCLPRLSRRLTQTTIWLISSSCLQARLPHCARRLAREQMPDCLLNCALCSGVLGECEFSDLFSSSLLSPPRPACINSPTPSLPLSFPPPLSPPHFLSLSPSPSLPPSPFPLNRLPVCCAPGVVWDTKTRCGGVGGPQLNAGSHSQERRGGVHCSAADVHQTQCGLLQPSRVQGGVLYRLCPYWSGDAFPWPPTGVSCSESTVACVLHDALYFSYILLC